MKRSSIKIPVKSAGDMGNKKPEYEVVDFNENGTVYYYICIKGTKTPIKPLKRYDTSEEADSNCFLLNQGYAIN
ncbi:hypothetical protein ACVT81_004122 [Yersinia enterocolitica]|uniref:hypothetical protein n=1 Tax=Yersinia enterocolitica TaxID=630 RepID=UPI0010E946FB|nr:Uncharacterised protein [Campylobacter jejuni]HDL8425966.1 hypothetical protein [Yersinia enterocolitica]HDM8312621.1 hypothetical protein [Yersinia enterocolitica]HDU2654098.1 hypothetical protein [Yersinia enterocolitica]HDV7144327.1 hypothetical protein [Yersinia enterocolitica]